MRGASLLRLDGKLADISRVLQGLLTADVSRLSSAPIAAAFLTSKGRLIADCTLFQHEDSVFIHADASLLPKLKGFVSMYKLRTPIDLHVVETSVNWNPSTPASSSGVSFHDPRGKALGVWGFHLPGSVSKFLDQEEYDRARVLHGVGEGQEIVDEIPLECNLDFLHAISFTKGCYLGQELVARTKFKGIVRKRIVPFLAESSIKSKYGLFEKFQKLHERIEDIYEQAPAASEISKGSKVSSTEGEVGEVIYFKGGRGLAKIRLDVLLKTNQLSVGQAKVFFHMPHWWPETDPVTERSVFEGLA